MNRKINTYRRSRFCRWGGAFLGWLLCAGIATAQETVIEGRVVNVKGEGLPSATIRLERTTDGDISDNTGAFRFSTGMRGQGRVRASMIGFDPVSIDVDLVPGDTLRLRLTLHETLLRMEEVTITADAYATGNVKGVMLSPLEVVTTPGAAADVFRAVGTFPGVASLDEGAGLFVRGGDVSETVTILDQATVVHPYRNETPTGGLFGTIPPFLVDGTYFSSGGFSARFGNALSGVLEMESLDRPIQTEYSLSLGLASVSLGGAVPVAGDQFGVRYSGNYSLTDVLFQVNGIENDFTVSPRGADLNLSLVYDYSDKGRIKFFNYATTERIGVRVAQPSYDALYENEGTNRLHNLQWSDRFGEWEQSTSLSLNSYVADRSIGSYVAELRDETWKLRSDIERGFGENLRLAVGAEAERIESSFRGTLPVESAVTDPEAGVIRVNEEYPAWRIGGYAELEGRPVRRLVVRGGVRADFHDPAGEMVIDPRLSVRYIFSKYLIARLAGGLYSQFPEPYQFNATSGNPNLGPQRADHIVLGIDHNRDALRIRLEAYYKLYHDLVLPDPEQNFANLGDGYARGLDLFVGFGEFLVTRFSGRLAYSSLQSERLQERLLGEGSLLESGPSAFDITHNVSLIGRMQLVGTLTLGIGVRYATGRPVTPVVDAVKVDEGEYYLPIEGPVNSERLPAFFRVDADLSYYLPFAGDNAAIFYLATMNLLDRVNGNGYDYSLDYSTRTLRRSNFPRSIYCGVSLTVRP